MEAFGFQETISDLSYLQKQRQQNCLLQRSDWGKGGERWAEDQEKRQSGYETPCSWSDSIAKSEETLNCFCWKLK
jgi:hypothetical protein